MNKQQANSMNQPRYAAVVWRAKSDTYLPWEASAFPAGGSDIEWGVCKGSPGLDSSYIKAPDHASAWALALNLTAAHAAGQADIRMKIRDALGMARALN